MSRGRQIGLWALLLAAVIVASCEKAQTASNATAGAARAPGPDGDSSTTAAPSAAPIPAAGGSSVRPQGATAIDPDPEAIALIYFSLAGLTPPFDDWARQDYQYVPDEFERTKKAAAAGEALRAKFTFAGTVGHIVMPLSSQLSEYDDKAGEFYVDAFSPSVSWSFPYKDATYRIIFTNGELAQHWKLSPSDAAAVITHNAGRHDIVVSATFDLTGVQRAAEGGMLLATVTKYSVEAVNSHAPLGTASVAGDRSH